jgi:transposase
MGAAARKLVRNDCPHLPSLLETTVQQFKVETVSADLGYSSRANLEKIESVGAFPLIPFKTCAVAGDAGSLWEKMFHYARLHSEEFFSRYHVRSNVESTFSMIKRKFGDSLRSKTDVAMRNETLAKIVCHNICCVIQEMHESGIDPTFGRTPLSPDMVE